MIYILKYICESKRSSKTDSFSVPLYCTQRKRTRESVKAGFSESAGHRTIYFGCLLLSLSLPWKIIQIYIALQRMYVFIILWCFSGLYNTGLRKQRYFLCWIKSWWQLWFCIYRKWRHNNFYLETKLCHILCLSQSASEYIQTNRGYALGALPLKCQWINLCKHFKTRGGLTVKEMHHFIKHTARCHRAFSKIECHLNMPDLVLNHIEMFHISLAA